MTLRRRRVVAQGERVDGLVTPEVADRARRTNPRARGQRSEAIVYLQEQLKTFYATPFRVRIQRTRTRRASKASALRPWRASRSGRKPVMLFVWAHRCSDWQV